MGLGRAKHSAYHGHHNNGERFKEREGRAGRRPIPRNYLQEVLQEPVYGEGGPTVREFLDKKYDNVDRRLPVYYVRNKQFNALVNADFKHMMANDDIDVTPNVRELMLMRSIPGHANSGHGRFRNVARYVNANPEWVYRALNVKAETIRRHSQNQIDPIFQHVEDIIKDPCSLKARKPMDKHGDPLSGSHEILRGSEGDSIGRLIGMYLASRMDNYECRQRVRQRFGIIMGGGRCYAVDIQRAIEEKVSLEDLSTGEHDADDIAKLVKRGIIIDEEAVPARANIINGYVRVKTGYGVSDDAAVITAGLLYGIDAAIGVLLTDSVDTWDKSTPKIYRNGQDEMLGDMILALSDGQIELPSDTAVEEFIYLSSINPMRVTLYPDCSQRRFNILSSADDESRGWTAAALHLEFVRRMRAGKLKEYEAAIVADRKTLAGSYRESAPVDSCLDMSKLKLYPSINKLPEVPISFRGVSSKAFQQAYIGRWNQAHEKGMIWSGDVQPRDTIVGQYTAAD